MLEAFIKKTFYQSTDTLIRQANEIVAEYAAQGYTLTLRQLYYAFVSRELLENNYRNYKRLGNAISDGRMAGLIDWEAIEDRARWLHEIQNFENPQRFIEHVVQSYREDLWIGQEVYCEVWVEKDALAGVVARSCDQWRVPYFPCKGYGSSSELYVAGKRLAQQIENGKHVVILHLGDHDPSGVDMTRDNRERLSLFAGEEIELRRIALNMDQIEQYDPPPNFAKETDSRHADYVKRFNTNDCWELDALEPKIINELIEAEIKTFIDEDEFNRLWHIENENRIELKRVADHWEDVTKYLKNPRDNKRLWLDI